MRHVEKQLSWIRRAFYFVVEPIFSVLDALCRARRAMRSDWPE